VEPYTVYGEALTLWSDADIAASAAACYQKWIGKLKFGAWWRDGLPFYGLVISAIMAFELSGRLLKIN
jgi:hypothetical protein